MGLGSGLAKTILCGNNVALWILSGAGASVSISLTLLAVPYLEEIETKTKGVVDLSLFPTVFSSMTIGSLCGFVASSIAIYCCCCYKAICRLAYIGLCAVGGTFILLSLSTFSAQMSKLDDTGKIKQELLQRVQSEYGLLNDDGTYSVFTIYFDEFQNEKKCCGANGPQDYEDSVYSSAGTSLGTFNVLFAAGCCLSFDPENPDYRQSSDYEQCLSTYEADPSTANVHSKGCNAELAGKGFSGVLSEYETYLNAYWSLSVLIVILMAVGIALNVIAYREETTKGAAPDAEKGEEKPEGKTGEGQPPAEGQEAPPGGEAEVVAAAGRKKVEPVQTAAPVNEKTVNEAKVVNEATTVNEKTVDATAVNEVEKIESESEPEEGESKV